MLNKSEIGGRAWKLLHLALLWVRKGGLFKSLPNFSDKQRRRRAIHYGERELSFDDTPIFHVKMHRRQSSSTRFRLPRIPCINPQVDFHYDFEFSDNNNGDGDDDDDITNYNNGMTRKSFLEVGDVDKDDDCGCDVCEEGIDVKAEEFISKFYDQMKLQRQVSYIQYIEMLDRGTS